MKLQNTDWSRRHVLQALAVAGIPIGQIPLAAYAQGKSKITKTIPSSGEKLAVIGMGTSRTFQIDPDAAAQSPLLEVLQAFFDHGGQLIDSSPMYGTAEAVTGELLRNISNSQDLFAATKVWINGKQAGINQMEQSMQRMGVERFDLMQIHNLRDWRTHIETLRDWKDQGKVRYIGITTSHGRYHSELEQILQDQSLDFVQLSYNIENRTAEHRLLPIAQEHGIATLINRPYQRGSLFNRVQGAPLPEWAAEIDCSTWGQFFLKFIAAHPAVTCIIPATSKVKHMIDNMTAGFGQLPDKAMRQRMIDYLETL